MKLKAYAKLCRVSHYIKNGLIFLPLLFVGDLFSTSFINVFLGFISFCFISSVVYIINDIKDVEIDKKHPVKCHRPLASGKIKVNNAIILGVLLFVFSMIFSYMASGFDGQVYLLLLLYLFINLLYSFGFKDIVILDILLLVSGFILRVYYGASIIDVNVSDWLYLTVMSGAFFFAFGKRRNELMKSTGSARKVLESYNHNFLDKSMYMSQTLTIVFYSLWVISQNTQYLISTIPLLIAILMKYTLVIEGNSHGDPTDTLIKDKVLLFLVLLLGIVLLYFMM